MDDDLYKNLNMMMQCTSSSSHEPGLHAVVSDPLIPSVWLVHRRRRELNAPEICCWLLQGLSFSDWAARALFALPS